MRTRDEVKAGIVIIIALVTLTALVLGVSGASFWERHDRYIVRLRSVAGLDQGAPVRLGGLKIGRVLRLRIPPEDVTQVEIALGVRQGFPIPQGTWATVATLGLLGDTYLQLTAETNTPDRIPPGGQIPAREASSIAEVLQQLQAVAKTTDVLLAEAQGVLRKEVPDLMQRAGGVADAARTAVVHADAFVAPVNRERVEKILATLDQVTREGGEAVRQALEHIGVASGRLEATVGTVQEVVAENRADLRESVQTLRTDLEHVGGLFAAVERTLESAQRALAETQQTVSHVDQFVTDNREGLEEMLTDLRRSTQNLRELTQSVKERPWTLIRTVPVPEKPGLEPSTSKEPRR
jgi:phospholipid/cholesterol/gamma-HCH transport system substrate-binding protein